jgi:triphosphatase
MQVDTMIELVEQALQTQAGKLDESLKRLFADPDEEAVHDVRVACRRTRVILNISEKLFRKRLLKAVQRRVKKLLSSLGDIRDAEVFSARAHEAVGTSKNKRMEELARLFDAETELRRIHSVAFIEREYFATLPRLIKAMAAPAAWEAKKIERLEEKSAGIFAAEILEKQMRQIRKFERLNAKSKSGKLHALRIEFKKLRYAAEFAEPAFSNGEMKPFLKFAKQMQEVLGKLQDTAVAEDKLTPWLRKNAGPAHSFDGALRELVHSTQTEAAELRAEFEEKWTTHPCDELAESLQTIQQQAVADAGVKA